MANTIYEVILSASGVPAVSVRSSDPEAVKESIAWARETLAHVQAPSKSELRKEEVPVCAVHKLPMTKVNGKRGEFWSCHQKDANGRWCSYRPITP